MSIAQAEHKLPMEVWAEVAQYIEEDRDMARFSAVCRLFRAAVDLSPILRLKRLGIYDYAFGEAQWTRYFGDIGDEPSLPANIDKIVNGPCPIWPGRKVRETHLLTLIPSHIHGKPLTLEHLEEIVKSPKGGGHASEYYYFKSWAPGINQKAQVPKNYWVLMTKDIIPGSRINNYSAQCKLLNRYIGYEPPRVYEAAISIFMEHARNGQKLYSDNPWTYTFCQETPADSKRHVIVGGFGDCGLRVFYDSFDFVGDDYALGAVRKFL